MGCQRSSICNVEFCGFSEQRITGIVLAHEIAKHHADTMSPQEVVDYAQKVNNAIYEKIIKSQ